MKNLYIYSFSGEDEVFCNVWKDVKIKRNGIIVKKRAEEFYLSQGEYKYLNELEKYINTTNFTGKEISCVSYATLNEDSIDLEKLKAPFIKQQEEILQILQAKLNALKICDMKNIIKREKW